MDEIWERTVETALDGQTNPDLVRTLTLDSMVKCVHGRLPPPAIFEKFKNLQHLSMANIGVSSLEHFPCLRNLQKLNLSDNRITGGLEFLVEAGLESLRDLDLSNNRISEIGDLRPLARLRLVSLDLYECPVTRVKDYRSRVFGLIGSLKYLDKMDAKENERLESDDDEEEEEDEEEDPESGEIDGEDHPSRANNWERAGSEGVVDVEEDVESEKDPDISRGSNGLVSSVNPHPHSNGFRVEYVGGGEDEDEGEDDDDLVEEVDEDVVEVHEINDSDDGEDGLEDEEDDEEDEEEEVDNDERDLEGPESTGKLPRSTEGEIDGHEQGEDDADEDDDGETGEEEQAVEEDGDFEYDEKAEDEEDDYGSSEYLVQPVGRLEAVDTGGSVTGEGEDPELEEDVEAEDEDEDNEDGEVQELPPSSSHKRKWLNDDKDSDNDQEEEDDIVQYSKSSKQQ